jgi:very-short-patch-repair endonuclease
VLDFYCAKARPAIEIDGESHEFADRPQRDERRDAWLKGNGVTVVHVPAAELQYQVEEIADWIMRLALEAQSK